MSAISNPFTEDGDERNRRDKEQIFSLIYPALIPDGRMTINNPEGRMTINNGGINNGGGANNTPARPPAPKESSSTNRTVEYYDAASAPPEEKKVKKKTAKYDIKAMERLVTGLIVVVIVAVIIILGCLIPVIYFLGNTTKLYRQAASKLEPATQMKDPFQIRELEQLLNEITTTARMTKNENERLKVLVRDSKLFGYCTHNIPSTACLPCSCTPFNKLNNEYQCDCTNLTPKRDCKDYYDNGFRISGVYTLRPDGINNVTVYCDQAGDGGGWEVIQRRTDGSTGFHRDWNEYKQGFGQLHRDFYLGNQHINSLTNSHKQLLVTIEDFNRKTYRAMYDRFSVMDDQRKYQLNCSGFLSGTAKDYFCKYHSGKQFSSYDNDNDLRNRFSCAASVEGGGGWWYSDCYEVNLNGIYYQTRRKDTDAIKWFNIDGENSLKKVEMKIRRP